MPVPEFPMVEPAGGGELPRVEVVELAQLDRRLAGLRLPAPASLARLRAAVVREGVRNPVVASTGVVAEQLVLVDGFKRVRVLEEQGVGRVRATLLALDASAAAAAVLQCNAPHRGLCDLEEAWVVRALCREHRVAQVEVGRRLARHKSWVCRRLQLAEALEEAVQADIRLGLLSATVARELVRLPRGNQVTVAGAVRDHALASRQAAQLVTLVLETADPEARRAVLADPLRYLAAARPASPVVSHDPRLTAAGNEVRRSLLALTGTGERLLHTCQRHAPAGLTAQDAPLLALLVAQARQTSQRAQVRLAQLLADSVVPAAAVQEG